MRLFFYDYLWDFGSFDWPAFDFSFRPVTKQNQTKQKSKQLAYRKLSYDWHSPVIYSFNNKGITTPELWFERNPVHFYPTRKRRRYELPERLCPKWRSWITRKSRSSYANVNKQISPRGFGFCTWIRNRGIPGRFKKKSQKLKRRIIYLVWPNYEKIFVPLVIEDLKIAVNS